MLPSVKKGVNLKQLFTGLLEMKTNMVTRNKEMILGKAHPSVFALVN